MNIFSVFVEAEQQLALEEKYMEIGISNLSHYWQGDICSFNKVRTFWSVLRIIGES